MATERSNQGGSRGGSQSQGGIKKNPGNFANDPERAREAGSKGGQSRGSSSTASAEDGRRSANATGDEAGEELRGMTEDGDEVIATLDDGDEGDGRLAASDDSEGSGKGGKH